MAVGIRRIHGNEEYQACVELQGVVWGEEFSERVPLAILKVGQRIGGVTAGAFDSDGRLLGFVFGLTGIERGELVHWSDMLAVRPEARDRGIGQRLKAFQRAELEALGVTRIYWTFDPLVARNAYLNLSRLGAEAVEYVVDMYGTETSSELHRGVGTDRLVICWWIGAPGAVTVDGPWAGAEGPRHDREAERQPLVEAVDDRPVLRRSVLTGELPVLTVQIPAEIEAIQRRSLAAAAEWRSVTREAFTLALATGYRIGGFERPEGAGAGGAYRLVRTRASGGGDVTGRGRG